MIPIDDIRDYDAVLKQRIARYQEKLDDWLAPYRLTLAEARVHKVLIPMVGVYTPGWQALPACAWSLVELVTNEGPVGAGEWSVSLPEKSEACIAELRASPDRNLLDRELEEPL